MMWTEEIIKYALHFHIPESVIKQKLATSGWKITRIKRKHYDNNPILDIPKEKISILTHIFEGTFTKISKSYLVEKMREQGYSYPKICELIGWNKETIRCCVKNRKRRAHKKEIQNIRKEYYTQIKKLRTKKVNLNLIIDTIQGTQNLHAGLKQLTRYVRKSTITKAISKYRLTIKKIQELSKQELKTEVVDCFLHKKTGLNIQEIANLLKTGKMVSIGYKNWEKLRNIGLTKNLILSNAENLKPFLVDWTWNYLNYFQTPATLSKRARFYKNKEQTKIEFDFLFK